MSYYLSIYTLKFNEIDRDHYLYEWSSVSLRWWSTHKTRTVTRTWSIVNALVCFKEWTLVGSTITSRAAKKKYSVCILIGLKEGVQLKRAFPFFTYFMHAPDDS